MHRNIVGFVLAAALVACSDATPTSTVLPDAQHPLNTSQAYPLESEVSHLAAYGFLSPEATITWQGRTATVASEMSFFGNYAQLITGVTIFNGVSEISHASTEKHIAGLFPFYGRLIDRLSRDAPDVCGHKAEGTATGKVELRALSIASANVITIYSKGETDRDWKEQEPCPTGGNAGGESDDPMCQLCLEWTWTYGAAFVARTTECGSLSRCLDQ